MSFVIADQIELTLPVAICAWCKPKERGSFLGAVSHGICPRHLRNLKFEMEGVAIQPHRRRVRAKLRDSGSESLLPL